MSDGADQSSADQTVMDSCAVNEMVLAEQLIEKTPDNSLTLFDRASLTGVTPCLATPGRSRVTGLFR